MAELKTPLYGGGGGGTLERTSTSFISVCNILQCPYCHKDQSILEAAEDKDFCLEHMSADPEDYRLKRNHAYYY